MTRNSVYVVLKNSNVHSHFCLSAELCFHFRSWILRIRKAIFKIHIHCDAQLTVCSVVWCPYFLALLVHSNVNLFYSNRVLMFVQLVAELYILLNNILALRNSTCLQSSSTLLLDSSKNFVTSCKTGSQDFVVPSMMLLKSAKRDRFWIIYAQWKGLVLKNWNETLVYQTRTTCFHDLLTTAPAATAITQI